MFEKIKFILDKNKLKRKKVYIRSGVNIKETKFGGQQKIGKNTNVKKSEIGFGSYIGNSCQLERVKIGKYCSIGDGIKVVSGTHPIKYVSTHPFSHSSYLVKEGFNIKGYMPFEGDKKIGNSEFRVEIENDVWIGSEVIILGGIKIGNGSVIGTGAVVTKDVEPYSIVVGVPAKILKYRFTDEEIKFLQNLKWWDKDFEWVSKNIEKFSDIKKFIESFDNKKESYESTFL